jgi:uncharacterized membrane protein
MGNFPLGFIVLILVCIVIYFGAAERALDRMRMKDRTALILIALIIAGSFIDLDLSERIRINLGGAVAVGVAVYLWVGAGTWRERGRSFLAAVITGLVLFLLGRFLGAEPERIFIDPLYIYPLVAGIVGYLAGRSRRGAFIAAVLGVMSLDITQYIYLVRNNLAGQVYIGGGGAFDSMIMAGVFAVLLAELVGEVRERMQGGPSSEGRPEELLRALKGEEVSRKPTEEHLEGKGAADGVQEKGGDAS